MLKIEEPAGAEKRLRELEAFLLHEIELLKASLVLNENHLAGVRRLLASGPETQFRPRPVTGSFRYANMRVIDAITAYLEATGRPHTEDELVREVLDGGVYTGVAWKANQAPEVDARKSIRHWLSAKTYKGRGKKSVTVASKLRKVGNLIGKAEWGNEKFQAGGK